MSQPAEQHKDSALEFEVELHDDDAYEKEELGLPSESSTAVPSICGLPLKYVSYVAVSAQRDRHRGPEHALTSSPSQSRHPGRPKRRAHPHHALLARVGGTITDILRRRSRAAHRAAQGLHIARCRVHEARLLRTAVSAAWYAPRGLIVGASQLALAFPAPGEGGLP